MLAPPARPVVAAAGRGIGETHQDRMMALHSTERYTSTMGKVVCLWVFLFVSMPAQADTCAVPSADPGEPYVTFAGLPKRELYLLLNEYMFVHHWTRHSEALSAGFRDGDRVYGQMLKKGGQFKPEATAAWRRAYTKAGHAQFLRELQSKIDMATVDRAVLEWLLRACLGTGLWSEVKVINDCRFVFTAGAASTDASPRAVAMRPTRFEVRGGRCGRWPGRPLSVKGDAVQCVRSGSGAVTIELVTDQGEVTRQTLTGLAHSGLPPEPLQERRALEPVSEVFRLWRSRDFRLQQLGRGCPSCGLYAADIRPSAPDAVILRAETVSSSGGGWQPCPAGLRCGVYEFSPPDNPHLSGCADLPVCRVWRLAETEAEASDVVQLTYQTSQVACVNCPGNLDYETAHRQWQEARDRAPGRCQVFADLPAQTIGPAPKN